MRPRDRGPRASLADIGGPSFVRGEREGLRIDDLHDDSLARYIKTCRRQLEDIDAGDPVGEPRWKVEHWLSKARRIYVIRFALRMRYGAADNGTDSWDRFSRLGEAPSYWLAAAVDRCKAEAGQRHILDWAVAS